MKFQKIKIEYVFLTVAVMSGLLLLLSKNFFTPEAPDNSLVVAEVIRTDNDVKVKYPLQYNWRKLKKGDFIVNGAVVYTGGKSLVSIILVDDTKIEQDEYSALEYRYSINVVRRKYKNSANRVRKRRSSLKTIGLNLIDGRVLIDKSQNDLIDEMVIGEHIISFERGHKNLVEIIHKKDNKAGRIRIFVDVGKLDIQLKNKKKITVGEKKIYQETNNKQVEDKVAVQSEETDSKRAKSYFRRQLTGKDKLNDFLMRLNRAFSF